MKKEQYTLIGGPLIGEAAPFIEEITIRRLLKNTKPIFGWTLEVPNYAKEHTLIQSPLYDNTPFDDLSMIYPHTFLLIKDSILSWDKLTIIYSLLDIENILQWHNWIWNNKIVDFVFRQYEKGTIQKIWKFNDVECRDLTAGENPQDTCLECKFFNFQQTFPIYK